MSLMAKLLASGVAGASTEGTAIIKEAGADNKARLNGLLKSMGDKFNTFAANKAAASKKLTRLADASSALKGLDPDMFGTYSNKQMTDLVRNLESIGGEGKAIETYLASKQDSTYSLVPQVLQDTADDSDAVTQTEAALAKSSLAPVGDRTGIEEAFKGKSYGKLQRDALAQLGISEAAYNAMVANQGALDSGPITATFKYQINTGNSGVDVVKEFHSSAMESISSNSARQDKFKNVTIIKKGAGDDGEEKYISESIDFDVASQMYISNYSKIINTSEFSNLSEEAQNNLLNETQGLQRALVTPKFAAMPQSMKDMLALLAKNRELVSTLAYEKDGNRALQSILKSNLNAINEKEIELHNLMQDNGQPISGKEAEAMNLFTEMSGVLNASLTLYDSDEYRDLNEDEIFAKLGERVSRTVKNANGRGDIFNIEELKYINTLELKFYRLMNEPSSAEKIIKLTNLQSEIAELQSRASQVAEPTPTQLEERASAIVDNMIANNPHLGTQREKLMVDIKAMLASPFPPQVMDMGFGDRYYQNMLIPLSDGKTKVVTLPISAYYEDGAEVVLTGKVKRENDEAIENLVKGMRNAGDIMQIAMRSPMAFTALSNVGKAMGDAKDFFNALKGTGVLFNAQEEIEGYKNDSFVNRIIPDAETAQAVDSASIALLGQAKDVLFDDPRLSDQDLAIVKMYIAVLNQGVRTIGATRAFHAMHMIQRAMAADWAIRTHKATSRNETSDAYLPTRSQIYNPPSAEKIAELQNSDKMEDRNAALVIQYNQMFGVNLGQDSIATRLTETLLAQNGTKLLTVSEIEKMNEGARPGEASDEYKAYLGMLQTIADSVHYAMEHAENYNKEGYKQNFMSAGFMTYTKSPDYEKTMRELDIPIDQIVVGN